MHTSRDNRWRFRTSHAALGLALAIAALPAAARAADATPADAAEGTGSEIVVTGTARHDPVVQAGPLGGRTILETPFSVAQVDSREITRIAASTIDAALSYDASVRSNNSGVASGNTFSVRGQAVDLTNGYKYDGLPFPYWYQDHPIEALEQIQILKGAGGFVYGYASPSGVVNFVSKKPTDQFEASANLSLRSSDIWRFNVDVGGPVREGSSTAFRLNAVYEDGTLYNGAKNRNEFVQLWLQGEIAPKLTWSLDGFYQRTWQANQVNSVTIAAGVTHLDPVNGADFNLGSKSTTKFNDIAQVTGRLNYEIADDWKVTAALRHSVLDERFAGNIATITSNAGDYKIGLLDQNRLFTYNVAQLALSGKFDTGPIEHDITAGFDFLNVNFYYDHQPWQANGRPTTGYPAGLTSNIYTGDVPDWGASPALRTNERSPDYFLYETIRQRSLYASDTLKWGGFELMAGLRWTRYHEHENEPNDQAGPGVITVVHDTDFRESSFTPVFALSYDVARGVRAYVSRVEALQRGGVAPDGTTNAGSSFGPIKSRQYEAGLKIDQPAWGGTLAVYRTNVPSEYTDTATNTFVRDGEARYQGIEFDGHVRLGSQLTLAASAAYLDAVQRKSSNAAVVGNKVPGTTAFQISGQAIYEPAFLPGLSLFAGVRHSGKAYAQSDNSFTFAAVTLGDAGVTYTLPQRDREIKLQANVQNIANTSYWVPNAAGTGLSAGAPRTFNISVGISTERSPVSRGYGIVGGSDGIRTEGWYLGLAGGGVIQSKATFDTRSIVTGDDSKAANALTAKSKTGWEVAGTLGYDFGPVRGELEVADRQARLSKLVYRDNGVAVADAYDTTTFGTGTYDHPGGGTHILSIMANALADFGGGEKSPWGFQAGGGLGLARINQNRWSFEDGSDTAFGRDNRTGFAFQAIAAVERRITNTISLSLKYRFFDVPGIHLQTAANSVLVGDVRTHSLLLGSTFRF